MSTSWGAIPDFNGDGFADVFISEDGEYVNPAAYIHYGGPSGPSSSPSVTLRSPYVPPPALFANVVGSVGDVNGDGYADLVTGSQFGGLSGGAMFYFPGGPAGLDATPKVTRTGGSLFGRGASGAGDVDADGYADFVVFDELDRLALFKGQPGGPATTPVRLAMPSTIGEFDFAGEGDVNGDGYGDVVVGTQAGQICVFLGGRGRLWHAPDLVIDVPTDLLYLLRSVGDVNGDGYTDVVAVFREPSPSTAIGAAVLLGGPCGLSSKLRKLEEPSDVDYLQADIVALGDIDADGFDDVAIGSLVFVEGVRGHINIYRGSAAGLGPAPSHVMQGPLGVGSGYFASHLGGLDDVNGDGFPDLATQLNLAVGIFLGDGTSFPPLPSLVVPSPLRDANYGIAIR